MTRSPKPRKPARKAMTITIVTLKHRAVAMTPENEERRHAALKQTKERR